MWHFYCSEHLQLHLDPNDLNLNCNDLFDPTAIAFDQTGTSRFNRNRLPIIAACIQSWQLRV
jgi:hypothetical protein